MRCRPVPRQEISRNVCFPTVAMMDSGPDRHGLSSGRTAGGSPRSCLLSVDRLEKRSAAGKIPGGYFKREGRLSETEVLTSRIIDRPCRPLFPKGWRFETQVIATVLSTDRENPAEVLAVTGASAALHLSDLPWDGPFAGVCVGRGGGEFVINPTFAEEARGAEEWGN